MNRAIDNRVEPILRQWIMLEEHQHEQDTAASHEEEDDITEIVFLPTGYELRGLKRAS